MTTFQIRFSLLAVGVCMYQIVQWNGYFENSPVVETIGLFMILLGLMPW